MIDLRRGIVALICLLTLVACGGPPSQDRSLVVFGGSPRRGWQAIQDYGCTACHTIPGVPGEETYVGPPLSDWAERRYIAGSLANQPENLMRWIQDPQSIEPGTAMPNTGVSDEDARHISAYLFTLNRN